MDLYEFNDLKGTSVMDDSIIGAGAITSKKFDEPNLMIAGINKVIKNKLIGLSNI